jgi:hypothetical protein
MEHHLPVIVRESSISKGAAVGLAAVGLGVLVLLACWGASLFWRVDNGTKERLDTLIKFTEAINAGLKQGKTEIVAKIDAVGGKVDAVGSKVDALVAKIDTIDSDLLTVSKQVAAIDLRISKIDPSKYYPPREDPKNPYVITREVTVFNNVKHDVGYVVTGWTYKDGAATEPSYQFCYYTLQGGEAGVAFRVDLFTGGKRVDSDAVRKIPDYETAYSKCQWFGGRAP